MAGSSEGMGEQRRGGGGGERSALGGRRQDNRRTDSRRRARAGAGEDRAWLQMGRGAEEGAIGESGWHWVADSESESGGQPAMGGDRRRRRLGGGGVWHTRPRPLEVMHSHGVSIFHSRDESDESL